MIDRRRFIKSVAAAAAAPAFAVGCQSNSLNLGPLQPDPKRILDLPKGFNYEVVSRRGDLMHDGLRVPAAHDGMAAFSGDDGRVVLICNHELTPSSPVYGAFEDYESLPDASKSKLYDRGQDMTPCLGGTTTTIYDPMRRSTESQFLSLGGTDINCAGGKTPWGSWLSCEESFSQPGTTVLASGAEIHHDQRHGYVFEVRADATGLGAALPLKEMGRFEHEAAAVHAPTGIVYMTEDRWHSLLYRFLPNVPGDLSKGGRLQALSLADEASKKTHNWDGDDIAMNTLFATRWIDLDDIDSDDNDLRKRGAARGAAMFARGEGLTVAGDQFAFTCTIGGPGRLGQVFTYKPSRFEGRAEEQDSPGQLAMIAQADQNSLLKNCDNLTAAPWGDLLLCEDTAGIGDTCSLIGIRPDGRQYLLANNAYSASELAGVCFAPDGNTLFLNIQYPGMTVAIYGPWANFR